MKVSVHNEYSIHRVELADGERERKENEQGRLIPEATMAEVFQVAHGDKSNSMNCKARFLGH
jgi:hypothetical protein